MQVSVHSLEHYPQENQLHRRQALLEKLVVTVVILIGLCGFTVVTLEAAAPPVELAAPTLEISAQQVTQSFLNR